jgi:hypothetical protein
MGSAAVHKLRSAISSTRDQQRLPLKTFNILASFCQISSLRSYPAGRDMVRCMRPALGRRPVHKLPLGHLPAHPTRNVGQGPAIEIVHYFGFVLPDQ